MKPSIVDYETARQLLINQANPASSDSLLARLQQSKSPVPGQITSILLALKVVFEALKDEQVFDRAFAYALFLIANESKRLFETGLKQSVDCPPLLNEDLDRIARSVKSIFSGDWSV